MTYPSNSVDVRSLVSNHKGIVDTSSFFGTNWAGFSATGDDLAGAIFATSGNVAPIAGPANGFKFAVPFPTTPRAALVTGALGVYVGDLDATGLRIYTSFTAAINTTYVWYYHVVA